MEHAVLYRKNVHWAESLTVLASRADAELPLVVVVVVVAGAVVLVVGVVVAGLFSTFGASQRLSNGGGGGPGGNTKPPRMPQALRNSGSKHKRMGRICRDA